jgi:hypothetical protein
MAVVDKSLEQKFEEKRTAKTVWDTDKKNWVYVTIPAENALGEVHDAIGINDRSFGPDIVRDPNTDSVVAVHPKTYLVPPEAAETINERLAVYNRACVRILQPKRDYKAEAQVDRFGSARASGISGQREAPAEA